MEVVGVGKTSRYYKFFPEHQHKYWEIMLNTEGSGIVTIEKKRYRFEPGSIVVIPPYTPHFKASLNGFQNICMFVKDMEFKDGIYFKNLDKDQYINGRHILEMALFYYTQSPERFYNQRIVASLGDTLYWFLLNLYDEILDWDTRVKRVVKQMYKNISNPEFDLKEVLDKTGYNRNYFRRLFKDQTGDSPLAYFNMLKINYAKFLMNQDRACPINEISRNSGFKDPLYFSRIFKKIEGVSPSEYFYRRECTATMPVYLDTQRPLCGNR